MTGLLTTTLCVFSFFTPSLSFNASAWQSVGQIYTFPENDVEEVSSKPNIAITFSGGGDRSFLSSVGYLSAFHSLEFMKQIKYMAGSSGGSWATAVYNYYQYDNITDAVMLGPVVFPQHITFDNLADMEPGCIRSFPNSSVKLDGTSFDSWKDAVQAIYFSPSGIRSGIPFSLNNATVTDIKLRNPSLLETEFLLLRGNFGDTVGIDPRPFPIIQATLIGPLGMLPFDFSNRNYTLVEWTPLSAGVAYSNTVDYDTLVQADKDFTRKTIGGLVEPYAFAGESGPTTGIPEGQSSAYITVPGTTPMCDIILASGTSSWGPGTTIAASESKALQEDAGQLNYWSPSAAQPSSEYEVYATGDGAGVSNTDLISLLQRNVSTILAFVSTSSPLQNSTHWDPATDPLLVEDFDFTAAAWFGQIAIDLTKANVDAYDLNNSQVFEETEWLPFITALQVAQASGNGNVISMIHTTVANPKYGIVSGRRVKVVWAYLGRALGWEAMLSEEMKKYVVPETDPYNQAVTIQNGLFKNFPNYPTTFDSIDIKQGNLLADFTGWMIYKNYDLYMDAIYPNVETNGSGDDDDDFVSSPGGIATIAGCALLVVGAVAAYYYVYGLQVSKPPPMADQESSAENNL